MGEVRWHPYWLTTLLVAVTLAAVALFAWMKFVAPHVTGYHLEDGRLVVELGAEAGRGMPLEDPYHFVPADSPDAFAHDAYISFPLYLVALAPVMAVGLIAGIYFVLRKRVGPVPRVGA